MSFPPPGNLLDPGNEPTSPASVTERCQVLSFQMQEAEWVGNSPGSKPSHRSARHSAGASSGGQTITQERQAQCGGLLTGAKPSHRSARHSARASSGGSLSPQPQSALPLSLQGCGDCTPRLWGGMKSPHHLPSRSVQFRLFLKHLVLTHQTPKGGSACPLHNAKIKPWQNIILAICSEMTLAIFRMLIMGSEGIFLPGSNNNVIKLNIHVSEGN